MCTNGKRTIYHHNERQFMVNDQTNNHASGATEKEYVYILHFLKGPPIPLLRFIKNG